MAEIENSGHTGLKTENANLAFKLAFVLNDLEIVDFLTLL